MGELRHDARVCRQRAASELIRKTLGIELPTERGKRQKHEAEAEDKRRKQEQKGRPLGLEGADD